MGVVDHLDGFCAPISQFWRRDSYCNNLRTELGNPNATCHDEVDLSLCFEDTAILYSICAVFWLLAGLEFLFLRSARPRISFNWLNITKTLLTAVPFVTALCDLAYTIYKGAHDGSDSVANYQYLTPPVLAISMVVAVLVLQQERRLGLRSSALLFLFWMSMAIYGSLKLRSLVLTSRDQGEVTDVFRFTTFCLQYPTYLLEFLLAFFPEPKSLFAYRWGDDQERKPCPEGDGTFLSRITWWWLNGLIWRGWRRSLDYDDLTDLNYEDKSRVVAPRFQRNWDKELQKAGITFGQVHVEEDVYQPIHGNKDSSGVQVQAAYLTILTPGRRRRKEPSLVWALAKSFWGTFLIAGILKVGSDLLAFTSPLILKLLIQFVEDPDEPTWRGYFYAVLLFLLASVRSFILNQHFINTFKVSMRVRTAVIAVVYGKALKMSNKARKTSTVGEIVTLMSVDAQRFMDVTPSLHMLWSAPLQITLALIFLYVTLGPSIFAGFAVMVLLIPINGVVAAISRRMQVQIMALKDSRIKVVNEMLNGIKLIKLYAWEIPFQEQIVGIRRNELKLLRKYTYLTAITSFTWTTATFVVALATFATYALVNRNSTDPSDQLTADKAFVALFLFNILRCPLSCLPRVIASVVQASVSLKRLRRYLKNEEIDPANIQWKPEPALEHEDAVSVVRGKFSWDTADPVLSDLNLHVQRGQLVAVVGKVGAGKSSLISALLGEMDKLAGSISLKGRVAYIPQQAWIQNATLKDNILFGKPFNEPLYKQTLHSCALEPDLEILPGGDMTEIGEKGINLSGGQKQRVSLARAVYQESDIYLLDDPLSAVDAHVGKHIFEKVIGPEGMLKGKVRILVTNALSILPQFDQIVAMDGGRVREVGTYAELIDANGAFAEFIRTYASVDKNEEENPVAASEYKDDCLEAPVVKGCCETSFINQEMKKGAVKRQKLSKQTSIEKEEEKQQCECCDSGNRTTLIMQEKAETGRVKFSVFLAYVKACTYYMFLTLVLILILSYASSIGSDFWLARWSNEEANPNSTGSLGLYLGVYAALGISQAIFIFIGVFVNATAGILASKTIHNVMLTNILRSPMVFFDTTPVGRILNRFSKDIYVIDEILSWLVWMFLLQLFILVSTILVIVITTPIILAVLIPLGVFYVLVQRLYVATSRQLKRLESVSRSPIYSHFQETLQGVASIRAYRHQERFILESERRVDYNQTAYYPSICANRWLAIRLEFIGNLVALFAALFAVLQHVHGDTFGRTITPGLVGLSVSYALQITDSLNWMVRMASDLETNIVAVERTKEYSETSNEAPAIIDSNRPPPDWPSKGHVRFDHYSTRYRKELDLVLRDIVADVPGGTKVGIVGRTGAGKSSLTLALFRIIEAANGGIQIDNLNIAKIGLQDLRSRITIIPQDPVLFSGTLRLNLDPFVSYSDEELWRVLESAHLSCFVSSLAEKLEHPIAEGGENLSVGQRQLLCLARALLRKTKILVLDEASAAVDMETDELVQKTIRDEFANCTVLTIAHRLNTVMDYDSIMVLDDGRITEFASPNELLSNKDSAFYAMAKDAGLV